MSEHDYTALTRDLAQYACNHGAIRLLAQALRNIVSSRLRLHPSPPRFQSEAHSFPPSSLYSLQRIVETSTSLPSFRSSLSSSQHRHQRPQTTDSLQPSPTSSLSLSSPTDCPFRPSRPSSRPFPSSTSLVSPLRPKDVRSGSPGLGSSASTRSGTSPRSASQG